MASRYFDEPRRQAAAVQQSAAVNNNVAAYAEQDDEELAKRIGAISQHASWIRPDAAFSLAKAGVTPEDPDFDKIAKAAGAVKTKKGLGWHSVGDLVSTGYGNFKATSRVLWDVGSYIPQTVAGGARTVHKNYETGGIKTALLGPAAGGQGVQAIQDQTNLGQIANASAATVADKPTGLGRVTDLKSAAGAAIDATGEGFFTYQTTPVGQAQVKAARDAWMIDGNHAFTPGRYLAQQVTEPGTLPYNLLSGFVDATAFVATDPTNAAIGLATTARNSKKIFNNVDDVMNPKVAKNLEAQALARANAIEDPAERTKAIRDAAGLVEGGRKAIIAAKADQWLTSKDGSKVLDHIAKSDFQTLYKTFGDKVPTESLIKLADTRTTTEADEVLRPMLGLHVNRALELPGFKDKTAENVSKILFKRDPKSVRLFQMMPGDKVNLDDVDDAVKQVERFAQNANLPEAVRLQRIEDMARATGRNARYSVLRELSADVAEELARPAFRQGELKAGVRADVAGAKVDLETIARLNGGSDRINPNNFTGLVTRIDETTNRAYFKNDNGQEFDVALDQLRKPKQLEREAVRKLTEMFHGNNDKMRKYFVDATSGRNMPVVGASIDGNGVPVASPHLHSEYIGKYAPLPDARDIREATTKWGRFIGGKPVTVTLKDGTKKTVPLSAVTGKTLGDGKALTDFLANGVWKKTVLLRPAYTVRVVGEEQLRMAGSRLDSLFNHPISAIAYITGRKGHLALTGDDIADASRLADDIDEFAAVQSRRGEYRSGGSTGHSQDIEFSLGNLDDREDYLKSWADQLMKLRGDEMTRKALGDWGDANTSMDNVADYVARAKEDFWSGKGKEIREDLATTKPEFLSRAEADRHIDSLVERAEQITNGDTVLMKALVNGDIRTPGATDTGAAIRDGLSPSKELLDYLRGQAAQGFGPSTVIGQKTFRDLGDRGLQAVNDAVDHAFYGLASLPTNKLSRVPVFNQYRWKKAEELLPFMTREAQEQTLKAARGSNLDKGIGEKWLQEKTGLGRADNRIFQRMEAAAKSSHGDLSLEEADELSKIYALHKTKGLLYDVTRRSQFFDAYRLVFAFGDAWKEVLTTWSKILVDNPGVVHTAQKVLVGGRGADVDSDGQGFFYTDPTTKEEMFTVPGSRWVNQAFTGQPIPFSSPVKGLNIFGTIVPGIGPAMQIPSGALIPDIPQADFVHKLFFPMGEVDRDAGGFIESYYPPWIKKLFLQGLAPLFGGKPADEKQYNNTVTNIMGQLVDSGKYDVNNPDEMQDAFEEARRKAPLLYILQGVAQSTLPSPPTQDFLVHDQDGRLVLMDILKNDMNKMYEEDRLNGTNTATKRFIDKYGTDVMLSMQPKSMQEEGLVPVTKPAKDWARQNTQLAKDYPKVYGLFAPSDGDFDIDAFSRQFRSGDRVALKPEQVLENTQATIGNFMYRQAKDKVKGRNDQAARAYLAGVSEQIIQEYPGFGKQSYSANELKTTISEMERAAKNPTVAATDAGIGFNLYMRARAKALESTGGKSFQSSTATQSQRDWLNAIGEAIIAEHPDFRTQWERVFSKEVSKNTNEEQ